MRTDEFDYRLPGELVAQKPASVRDESNLMVLDRRKKSIAHCSFKELLSFLHEGDALVLNNSKVMPARLSGVKEDTGAKLEFLLLREREKKRELWEVLSKPGRRVKAGGKINFDGGRLKACPEENLGDGRWVVSFEHSGSLIDILNQIGEMPLPPYIKRAAPEEADLERYQTVYAKRYGGIAAPTAGLHFSNNLLEAIREKGVSISEVTIHPGPGTFKPVRTKEVEEHSMESEYYELGEDSMRAINKRKKGMRLFAVGTTTARVIESLSGEDGRVKSQSGWTALFIYPGYRFKAVDSLITNFHAPRSTVLLLASAFAGRDFLMRAYAEAIKKKYRFLSFGDAMLII